MKDEKTEFTAEINVSDVMSWAEANDIKCSAKKAKQFIEENSEALQEACQSSVSDYMDNELFSWLEESN